MLGLNLNIASYRSERGTDRESGSVSTFGHKLIKRVGIKIVESASGGLEVAGYVNVKDAVSALQAGVASVGSDFKKNLIELAGKFFGSKGARGRMRNFFACISILLSVAIISLYLVSKTSDSYSVANIAVKKSDEIIGSIGNVKYTILIGSRHKLLVNDTSCGSLTFLVVGASGLEAVEVFVRKGAMQSSWDVYDVVAGYFSSSEKFCKVRE